MHFVFNPGNYSGVLINSAGDETYVAHHVHNRFDHLIDSGLMDTLLIEPEDGFSQLGGVRTALESLLGLQSRDLVAWGLNGCPSTFEPNIPSLADFARSDDPDITLTAIASRKENSPMKGLVLVPYESSRCYLRYSNPYSKPYRDFFYNVTYEALYYAYHVWGSRQFAITHLSREKIFGHYKPDVTTCQAEAVRHFCELYRGVKSVVFWDTTKGNRPIYEISRFDEELDQGAHRLVERSIEKQFGIDFIRIEIARH
jgi:hypothetical protein